MVLVSLSEIGEERNHHTVSAVVSVPEVSSTPPSNTFVILIRVVHSQVYIHRAGCNLLRQVRPHHSHTENAQLLDTFVLRSRKSHHVRHAANFC